MTDSGLVNSDPGADPLVGSFIEGTYEVLSRIGKGGMGSVYRAHHLHLDRTMAVKVLRGYASRGPVIVQRFRQEARALNLLNHPNIVSCYAFGFHDDSCYLVMDFVDGTTLADEIALHGKLSTERFRRIFSQVCSALQHAHTNGIVHRDLKPENIMLVTEDGHEDVVKLLDFGIAKVLDSETGDSQQLTKTGVFMGSPLCMSPEQCRAETLDARSDIYSLGCVMYLSVAGRGAFDADSIVEIIHHQLYDPPPELSKDVPPQLANVIYSCLEKLPANRPSNVAEVLAELESPLTASVKVRRPSRSGRRSSNAFLKKLTQHKLPVAAAAVLIAGSLGYHYYTHVVSLDILRKTCDSLTAQQSAMVQEQFSNRHPYPPALSPGYLEIYKQTDKLLKSRIAYANALLDQDQVAQAVDVAAGLDLDIQRQQRTTRCWPVLQSDTIDSIKTLGNRFADMKPAAQGQEQAANCLYLAAAGHFVRMMNCSFLHCDPLVESEHIVAILEAIHSRRLDNACPTLHSLTEEFPIQHRPDAYIFAIQSAGIAKNPEKARLYSARVRATIDDITQDRTCLRSQDTQGQSLLKAAQQLISLDMNDDAAPLLNEAARLCRLESTEPGPGAPQAGYLLATLGQRQHLGKDKILKFIELSVRASQFNKVSQLPALVEGAAICHLSGDKKGESDYINRALKAPRNDASADLQMDDLQRVTGLRLALMLAENGRQLEAQNCIEIPLKRMYGMASHGGTWNEYMQYALAAAHQYRVSKMTSQSRELLQDLLKIALQRQMRPEVMAAELGLFGLDFDAADYGSAIKHTANALDTFEHAGGPAPSPDLVVKTYLYKATAEYRVGQFDASYRDVLSGFDYLEKHPEADALHDKAILTLYAGVDCSRLRRFEEAARYLYQSRPLWEKMESADPVLTHTTLGTVTTELSSALAALGRKSEAKAAQTWLQTYLKTHHHK